jgi:hypothetical protein
MLRLLPDRGSPLHPELERADSRSYCRAACVAKQHERPNVSTLSMMRGGSRNERSRLSDDGLDVCKSTSHPTSVSLLADESSVQLTYVIGNSHHSKQHRHLRSGPVQPHLCVH